jgi:hypothetical protein
MATFVDTANEGEALGLGTAALQALIDAVPVPVKEIEALGLRVETDSSAIVGSTITRTVRLALGPSETADGTLTLDANGGVQKVTLGTVGRDYVRPPIATVNPGTSGKGFGALLVTFLSVREVAIDNGGAAYGAGATVQFIGGLPAANARMVSGCVRRIAMIKPGLGYGVGTTVSIEGGAANGSSPAVPARASIVLDAFGRITSITLLDMGEGYVQAPKVFFHPPAGAEPRKLAVASVAMAEGTPARATLTVALGVITAVNLTQTGHGYIAVPNVVITDSTGAGAILRPRMRIDRIDVRSTGLGYTSSASLVLTPFFKAAFADGTDQTRPFSRFMEKAIKQGARTPIRALTPVLIP